MIDRPGDVESLVRPRSALELKRWLMSVPGWARRKVRAEWGGRQMTWNQACMLYVVVKRYVPRKDNVAGHFVKEGPALKV